MHINIRLSNKKDVPFCFTDEKMTCCFFELILLNISYLYLRNLSKNNTGFIGKVLKNQSLPLQTSTSEDLYSSLKQKNSNPIK